MYVSQPQMSITWNLLFVLFFENTFTSKIFCEIHLKQNLRIFLAIIENNKKGQN